MRASTRGSPQVHKHRAKEEKKNCLLYLFVDLLVGGGPRNSPNFTRSYTQPSSFDALINNAHTNTLTSLWKQLQICTCVWNISWVRMYTQFAGFFSACVFGCIYLKTLKLEPKLVANFVLFARSVCAQILTRARVWWWPRNERVKFNMVYGSEWRLRFWSWLGTD